MKIDKLLLAVALGAVAFSAQARKDCTELKSEIDAKFQAKAVKGYSLDIVPAADVGDAKVVGTCDGGSSRIVYTRGGSGGGGAGETAAAPAPAAPAPAAPKKKNAPPPLGNY